MDRRTALGHVAALTAGTLLSGRPSRAAGSAATAPAPHDAGDYREAALAAERWIARSAIRDASGTRWPVDPLVASSVDQSLYSGCPGVVLFYLELHHATGDRRYLDEARAGARALVAALPADPAALGVEGAGMYTGVAGTTYVLRLVQERAPSDDTANALARIAKMLRSVGMARDVGGGWNDSNDIISGTCGIALTLMWHGQRDDKWKVFHPQLRNAARSLIAAGESDLGGTKWRAMPQLPKRYPNFSHGTAGVSYTLATLAMHDALRSDDILRNAARDAALSGERYLDRIATRTPGGGRKVFHSEPGGEQLYYLSWCHGPAGTARLYRQLERMTGDQSWRAVVSQLSLAIREAGVPEVHPDLSGYWNNISQCCGNCGVAEYFVARHRAGGDAADLAFGRRVMDDVLARATRDGDGLKWVQAENRVSPKDVVAQTGYMQGAAGVGVALLHLEGAMSGRAPLVVLPDTPVW